MTTALWVLQGLLAAAFLGAGSMKLMKKRTDLIPMGMSWAEDFTDGQVKIIGALELAGGIGVIVPSVTGILPVVAGVAAAGLVLTMLSAAALHARRKEMAMIAPPLVLGALAAYVAYSHLM
jgi:uncharacterized membrane protein